MRQLLRVVGTIVVLVLLVAVIVGAAQNLPAAPEQGQAALTAAESRQQVEDTVTVCAILIGGTSLLAGLLWMKRLR
jgi:hypothetical protein